MLQGPFFAVLLLGAAIGGTAAAEMPQHGIAMHGDVKYKPGFTHFDYVKPDAPKGGRLSMIGSAGVITFNSLNGYILKGDAAQGIGYLFDSLMVRAEDEPDAMYGLVAAFGLTAISAFLLDQQDWLKTGGGLFLLFLGLRTLTARTRTTPEQISPKNRGLLAAYGSTFLLTLANPATILSFMAIYAGLGLAGANGDYRQAGTLVLGVFVGSAIWWLLLSAGVCYRLTYSIRQPVIFFFLLVVPFCVSSILGLILL